MEEKYIESSRRLLDFIKKSPSCFHVVENFTERLLSCGFTELKEEASWKIVAGGKYFVCRNDSSIIAFVVPSLEFENFQIAAAHSDSPSFKIKENPEMCCDGIYVKLNIEKYGGMICAPWFDRPLSVAGKITVKTKNGFECRLVNIDRDLLLIPNLAIHMDRNVNDGHAYNVQNELLPLFACSSGEDGSSANDMNGRFLEIIAENAGVKSKDILGTDLFLYNRQNGSIWGADNEFISSAKLDDLQCAYALVEGLIGACCNASQPTKTGSKNKSGDNALASKTIPVVCVFDNEEVGSTTKQGADSTFLSDVLERICISCCASSAAFTGAHPTADNNLAASDKSAASTSCSSWQEEYRIALSKSFMISADNAHAVHPNYSEKADPTNRPYINGGIVIKFNANQKYTTDSVSEAVFKELCNKAGVPFQTYVNRSDIAGGSTLGNISNSHVSINTVDVGLPQLAMHSPYETAGVMDTQYLIELAEKFFRIQIKKVGKSFSFIVCS